MKFEQEPHPLVEEHHYIQNLINSQEKRAEDRTRHQNIKKNRDVVQKMIAGFKDIELLDFYCASCKKDFVGRAKKQLDSWSPIAYYKMKHKCGTWAIRLITDRERDSYFFNSRVVAKQRGEHFGDLLQSFENNYNLLYGK